MSESFNDSMLFVTPADLARRWLVSGQTIRNLCEQKKINALKVGRFFRIHVAEIERLESVGIPKLERRSRALPDIPDEIGN